MVSPGIRVLNLQAVRLPARFIVMVSISMKLKKVEANLYEDVTS
jgi:hypothetical protein